ncbi:MAG: xanthine dehydrogenase family protein molybdopterin-binding subunit, partial [Mesorhizobium sp.]
MSAASFPDRARVDARDKVRGATLFPGDVPVARVLYAMTVPSRIAKGTMTALDTSAAMRVPAVVRVLTPDDFPPPPPVGKHALP